jgi:hypothetical protein
MYIQKVIIRKTEKRKNPVFVGVLKVNAENQDPEPETDSLVRGTDPRIRIRTEMSRIRNTGLNLQMKKLNRYSAFSLLLTTTRTVKVLTFHKFSENSVKLIYFFLFSKYGRICLFTINIIISADI